MAPNGRKRSRSTVLDAAGNTQPIDDFRPLKIPRHIRQLRQRMKGVEPIKTTEPTSFPLMRLPLELRLEIYGYVLQPKELEIKSCETTPRDCSELRKPVYRAASLDFSEEAWDQHATAILRTCKQIHREALPILHRPKKLTLMPLWLPSNPARRCKFDPLALSMMFRLETLHIDLNLRVGFREQMLAHSRGLAECFNEALVVRRIVVRIEVQELEFALRSRIIPKYPATRDSIIADQVAILQVWRDALARAHHAEQVEIRYAKHGRTLVTWKKERMQQWRKEEIWDEDTADDDWYSLYKRCYNALVPAAMEIFGPYPDVSALSAVSKDSV